MSPSDRSDERERGAVAAMMVVLAVAFLVLIGLVYDGARIAASRREATNVALQSARVGAQHLDVSAAYSGVYAVDVAAAELAARDFLTAVGADAVPDTVRESIPTNPNSGVSVSNSTRTTILSASTVISAWSIGVTEEE